MMVKDKFIKEQSHKPKASKLKIKKIIPNSKIE